MVEDKEELKNLTGHWMLKLVHVRLNFVDENDNKEEEEDNDRLLRRALLWRVMIDVALIFSLTLSTPLCVTAFRIFFDPPTAPRWRHQPSTWPITCLSCLCSLLLSFKNEKKDSK